MIIMPNTKGLRRKMEYTFDMFMDDIQDDLEYNDGNDALGDRAARELKAKRIVMQMLINLACKFTDSSYKEEERLHNALEVTVNGDELLSGYAFFVSQKPQFYYTWGYMRKRGKSYIEFLVNAVLFLKAMLSDINILASRLSGLRGMHFVFNDIFDVSLIPESPHVKTRVRWEDFYRIATIKRGYNVLVKKEGVILLACDRNEAADVVGVAEAAIKMVSNAKTDF